MVESSSSIAVVGSGISGLACAQRLQRLGHSVAVFDKGRSPGGRLATRLSRGQEGEPGVHQFDHGAQFFTVRSAQVARAIDELNHLGVVARWEPRVADPEQRSRLVGLPRMRALPEQLASRLTLHQSVEIGRFDSSGEGWWLVERQGGRAQQGGKRIGPFSAVLLTAPGPQSAALLREQAPELARACESIRYSPCWAAMVALETPLALDLDWLPKLDGALQLLVRDSSKPGRRRGERWVAHASHAFSQENLELDREVALQHLLEAAQSEWSQRAGSPLPSVAWARAHRWRYARVERPLGRPHLWDPGLGLGVAGDGLIGPRVEDAWLSGLSLASAVAEAPPGR